MITSEWREARVIRAWSGTHKKPDAAQVGSRIENESGVRVVFKSSLVGLARVMGHVLIHWRRRGVKVTIGWEGQGNMTLPRHQVHPSHCNESRGHG